jgi:hypothetical protein
MMGFSGTIELFREISIEHKLLRVPELKMQCRIRTSVNDQYGWVQGTGAGRDTDREGTGL